MTILLLLVSLTACRGPAPSEPAGPAPAARPSLVLVTLDTTRADRLGCYGYPGAATPTLDRLAATGWRFERAYSSVPLTTPSHATILSGLYPTRHGIHSNGDAVLPESVETLAERLAAAGYRTAASVGSFTTTRIWNFDQGFEVYHDEVEGGNAISGRWGRERSAAAVVDSAIEWLGASEPGPYFLWVHFFDAHDPYAPPEPFATRFAERPYDGEIAYVDEQIGRLQRTVETRGGPVVWIAVGDHGEALEGEHGEYRHGLFLFDETTRVPLIVRPATPLAEGRVLGSTGVATADVVPTALDLLGLPAPPGLDGRDLGPLIAGSERDHPGVYLEAFTALRRFGYHPEVGWTDGAFKLMDTPRARLFDLGADPAEATDVLAGHAAEADAFRARLAAVREQGVVGEALAPAPEVAEQLQALGYMDGGFAFDPEKVPTVDAKDRLDVLAELERLRQRAVEPDGALEAAEAYRAILQREPGLQEAYLGLARACGRLGRHEEARAALETAVAAQPDSAVLRSNLANALANAGRKEEGLAVMESILAAVPQDDVAQVGVLRMLTDLGREQEVVSRAEVWLAEDRDNPPVEALYGVALTRLGRYAEAEPMLEASKLDGVPRQLVERSLATIAEDRGELARAVRHMRREMDAFPGTLADHAALADLHSRLGSWDDAAAEYEFLAGEEPAIEGWRRNWAQAVFNTGDYELAAQILAPLLARPVPLPETLLLQANILAKQGRREEGRALFERAQAMKQAEVPAR